MIDNIWRQTASSFVVSHLRPLANFVKRDDKCNFLKHHLPVFMHFLANNLLAMG